MITSLKKIEQNFDIRNMYQTCSPSH